MTQIILKKERNTHPIVLKAQAQGLLTDGRK